MPGGSFAQTFTPLRLDVTERVQDARMSVSPSGGWMRSALVALLVVVASCAGQPEAREIAFPGGGGLGDDVGGRSEPAPEGLEPARAEDGLLHPVVLVTIDGARWQEIFEGSEAARTPAAVRSPDEIVPNLTRMGRERGAVIGAPGRGVILASGPNFISLPGYTEIFTGRPSRACQDNDCPGADTPTLLDQAHGAGAKVAAFGSWEKLERATTSSHDRASRPFLVSAGREGDPAVNPWPGHGDYRPDRHTTEVALAFLEQEQPDVLFVGLGDPDEHAHHGDYEAYLASLTDADAFVGKVFDALARMGNRGERTHVFVTADHGRAADFKNHGGFAPESARVWLFAAGPSIAARGRVMSARPHYLADVTPTLRNVMGLAPDRASSAGRAIEELFVGAVD